MTEQKTGGVYVAALDGEGWGEPGKLPRGLYGCWGDWHPRNWAPPLHSYNWDDFTMGKSRFHHGDGRGRWKNSWVIGNQFPWLGPHGF